MTDLPPVGRPAQRGLASAGYSSIEQLAGPPGASCWPSMVSDRGRSPCSTTS
jgi:hypothetical protein